MSSSLGVGSEVVGAGGSLSSTASSKRSSRYILDGLLQEGAPGAGITIYRARHRHNGKHYALKALDPSMVDEHDFADEVTLLASVRDGLCPYVVKLEDSFVDAGTKYYCIVTGLVEGPGALYDYILSGASYTLSDVVRWGMQMALGLVALQGAQSPVADINSSYCLSLRHLLLSAQGDIVIDPFSAGKAERRGHGTFPPPEALSRPRICALGVCIYLLATRQVPMWDAEKEASGILVDQIAATKELNIHLEGQIRHNWAIEGEDNLNELQALVEVLTGIFATAEGDGLSAQQIIRLLREAQERIPRKVKRRYNKQLRHCLLRRPDLFGEVFTDCQHRSRAGIVRLEALDYGDRLRVLDTDGEDASKMARKKPARRAVMIDEVVDGHVAGKGLNFIVGPPGAGKTTIMYCLALLLAEAGDEAPLVVHAHDLLCCFKDLEPKDLCSRTKTIACLANAVDPDFKADWPIADDLMQILRHPVHPTMLTLLIDGLDEIKEWMELLEQVNSMQTLGTDDIFRRIFISCRPGAFDALQIDKSCVESVLWVVPPNARRSLELADLLLQQWSIQDVDLIDDAKEAASKRFQGSPLLIYLLCWLVKEREKVVKDGVQLFEEALDLLLLKSQDKYGITMGPRSQLPWRHVTELSSIVAYIVHHMGFQNGSDFFDKLSVRSILQDILWSSPAGEAWKFDYFPRGMEGEVLLIEALEDMFGALCQPGRGKSSIFLHRSIQEFLTAKFLSIEGASYHTLAALRDEVMEGGEKAGNLPPFGWSDGRLICSEWWSEVYRFAGLMRGPRWLAGHMMEGQGPSRVDCWLASIKADGLDRQDAWLCRLRHAMRACCGSDVPHDVVQDLVQAFLSVLHRMPALFESLVQRDWLQPHEWSTFPSQGFDTYFSSIITSVASCDAIQRHAAAGGIMALGDGTHRVPGLAENVVKLLYDSNPFVRSSGAEILCQMGDAAGKVPAVMEALLSLLTDDDATTRSAAAYILGEMARSAARRPDVVEELMVLFMDAIPDVRSTAVVVAGKLSEHRDIPDLANLLEDLVGADPDAEVRVNALDALIGMGGATVGSLVYLLGDRDHEICCMAASALGEIDDAVASRPGVVKALLKTLSHENWMVRASAEATLNKLGRADQAVMAMNRSSGQLSMSSSREGSFLRDLDFDAGSETDDVRERMRDTAKTMPGFIEAVIGDVGSSNPVEASSAATVLGSLGETAARTPGAIQSLIGILGSYHSEVRNSAAAALGKMGELAASHQGVLESLVILLSSIDWRSRKMAAEALSNMREAVANRPGVVQSLVDLLGDADVDMRSNAADVLHNVSSCGLLRMAPPAAGGGRLAMGNDSLGRESLDGKEERDDDDHHQDSLFMSRVFLYLPIGGVLLCILLAMVAFVRCFQILYYELETLESLAQQVNSSSDSGEL